MAVQYQQGTLKRVDSLSGERYTRLPGRDKKWVMTSLARVARKHEGLGAGTKTAATGHLWEHARQEGRAVETFSLEAGRPAHLPRAPCEALPAPFPANTGEAPTVGGESVGSLGLHSDT